MDTGIRQKCIWAIAVCDKEIHNLKSFVVDQLSPHFESKNFTMKVQNGMSRTGMLGECTKFHKSSVLFRVCHALNAKNLRSMAFQFIKQDSRKFQLINLSTFITDYTRLIQNAQPFALKCHIQRLRDYLAWEKLQKCHAEYGNKEQRCFKSQGLSQWRFAWMLYH